MLIITADPMLSRSVVRIHAVVPIAIQSPKRQPSALGDEPNKLLADILGFIVLA